MTHQTAMSDAGRGMCVDHPQDHYFRVCATIRSSTVQHLEHCFRAIIDSHTNALLSNAWHHPQSSQTGAGLQRVAAVRPRVPPPFVVLGTKEWLQCTRGPLIGCPQHSLKVLGLLLLLAFPKMSPADHSLSLRHRAPATHWGRRVFACRSEPGHLSGWGSHGL